MKKFIQTLKNIWSIEDLKKRLLYTLGLILLYRFGSYVMLPGIDAALYNQAANITSNRSNFFSYEVEAFFLRNLFSVIGKQCLFTVS